MEDTGKRSIKLTAWCGHADNEWCDYCVDTDSVPLLAAIDALALDVDDSIARFVGAAGPDPEGRTAGEIIREGRDW